MSSNDAMIKVTRSDGRTFELGTLWGITKLEGIDAPDFHTYTSENATGDGVTITGERAEKRLIAVSATLRGVSNTLTAAARSEAVHFFALRYTYRLDITYRGVTRWTMASLDAFSCPSGNVYAPVKLTAEFICPDPWLRSVDDFAQNIALVSGYSGFPYMVKQGGAPVGVYNFARSVAIYNDGDVPVGFRAVLYARGEVENPRIIKGDSYVKILDTMEQGDIIEIDLTEKTITKNGVNYLSRIDRSSNFTGINLGVGDNTIAYDADNGNNLLDVTLYFNLGYVGM